MPPAFLEDLRKADFESLSFFQSLSDVCPGGGHRPNYHYYFLFC